MLNLLKTYTHSASAWHATQKRHTDAFKNVDDGRSCSARRTFPCREELGEGGAVWVRAGSAANTSGETCITTRPPPSPPPPEPKSMIKSDAAPRVLYSSVTSLILRNAQP